ncbi:hypothetical protein J2787_000621 [Chryseobacterium rhizosphaerae]|uniref:DUF1963 domain-containing protein n=1 Tax=Chryseobacterium rhizosphaerae TaxID=395937 RepID=A0AAE3Y849_9FLAO|nr:hypothetical protein [Chryseobacterium rhizosphaerae]MDR6525251.1 hypothetical protein [Chryseobacterium rhizosphaerae]
MKDLIKIFPEYEDVFYDDIENHKKYFLPICSINLKIINPSEDQWLHIVSVKEIYDGCVGENKPEYHTEYTKSDMFSFDVMEGKYKFDADWNYFSAHTEISPEDYGNSYSDLEIEYNMNEAMYQLKKEYYQKHNKLYDKDSYRPGLMVDDIRRLERLRKLTVEDLEKDDYSEYAEERLQKKVYEVFDELNTASLPVEETHFGADNLIEKPYKNDDTLMDYIGCMEGYDFQNSAADLLYLFYDKELKKAVICLEYT